MNVDAQWLSAYILRMNAGGIGEPVVGMDDVELLGALTVNQVDYLIEEEEEEDSE